MRNFCDVDIPANATKQIGKLYNEYLCSQLTYLGKGSTRGKNQSFKRKFLQHTSGSVSVFISSSCDASSDLMF